MELREKLGLEDTDAELQHMGYVAMVTWRTQSLSKLKAKFTILPKRA